MATLLPHPQDASGQRAEIGTEIAVGGLPYRITAHNADGSAEIERLGNRAARRADMSQRRRANRSKGN
jgi:hypothetical protein